MSDIGPRLREMRKKRGMTLDQVATASGSSKSYIWELENKARRRPSAEKLATIARVLGTTADQILTGAGGTEYDRGFQAGMEYAAKLMTSTIKELGVVRK